jgi:hypothetical protein
VYQGIWCGTTTVALKLLKAEDEQAFMKEIELLKYFYNVSTVHYIDHVT